MWFKQFLTDIYGLISLPSLTKGFYLQRLAEALIYCNCRKLVLQGFVFRFFISLPSCDYGHNPCRCGDECPRHCNSGVNLRDGCRDGSLELSDDLVMHIQNQLVVRQVMSDLFYVATHITPFASCRSSVYVGHLYYSGTGVPIAMNGKLANL